MLIDVSFQNKKVVIIGGGKVALHKASLMVENSAKVTVISPEFLPEFAQLNLTLIKKKYDVKDIILNDFVFACTNDLKINEQISRDAKKLGKFINNVSDPSFSDFTNVATLQWENFFVGVAHSKKEFRQSIALRNELKKYLEEKS